jgi:hypothetical protein
VSKGDFAEMKVEMMAVERIKPYQQNPKAHPEGQINDLPAFINESGGISPLWWMRTW